MRLALCCQVLLHRVCESVQVSPSFRYFHHLLLSKADSITLPEVDVSDSTIEILWTHLRGSVNSIHLPSSSVLTSRSRMSPNISVRSKEIDSGPVCIFCTCELCETLYRWDGIVPILHCSRIIFVGKSSEDPLQSWTDRHVDVLVMVFLLTSWHPCSDRIGCSPWGGCTWTLGMYARVISTPSPYSAWDSA